MYDLWEACEEKRREVTELKKEIEYCTRTEAIDKSLSYQVNDTTNYKNNILSVTYCELGIFQEILIAMKHLIFPFQLKYIGINRVAYETSYKDKTPFICYQESLYYMFFLLLKIKGISELEEKLTAIEPDHRTLSESLNTTLHELPTKDILIPNEGTLNK